MNNRPSCILVVDGGVDLPAGAAAEYGLHTVPLMLHFGNEVYRSGVDITAKEFYQRLRERGEFPTTSQPSAGEYRDVYVKAAEAGLPIISIHVSSGLSGSLNSARTAREMLPDLDITLVDTKTLSGEMAMQVLVAASMAQRGEPVSAIVSVLSGIYDRSNLFFTIDKLDYLRKGGRIGRVAGAVGSLLGIRPIVTVDKSNGTYIPAGKARSFRRAIDEIGEKIIADVGEGNDISVMIMQGDCPAEVAGLKAMLEARLNVIWFHELHANPSLGAHIGPDAMGVAYYPGALPILSVESVGVR
ncbi:MAG: DegV family protein [Bacillota bacterium]